MLFCAMIQDQDQVIILTSIALIDRTSEFKMLKNTTTTTTATHKKKNEMNYCTALIMCYVMLYIFCTTRRLFAEL
jgi:hypothetical protein